MSRRAKSAPLGVFLRNGVLLRNRVLLRTFFLRAWVACAILLVLPGLVDAREREPNAVFADRRARLVAGLNAPVVLFGYTGKENSSPSYVFNQEESFYYLTGHNEEGAALLVLPPDTAAHHWKGPHEILFLPPRDLAEERWNGVRIGPQDPDVVAKTGVAGVEDFSNLKTRLADVAKNYREIYTLLPQPDDTGYPHAREGSEWLQKTVPSLPLRDAAPAIAAMRQIKSPGEIALLTKAIELSMDAHLVAMRMMRPGLFEYQVAARMVEVHAYGGCEAEAYAPIVGTGFDSTVLHFNELSAQIKDGDVVLMDVGGQYGGYAADVTRTVPANGHFTPRQRELYEVVLGAQNAALAALKPGMTIDGSPSTSLFKIAMDYINQHGKDLQGRSLGRYFIHGLSHHIGLDVHDPGETSRPLEPGMVITVEPGIYIPEEKIGIRIEDDVLVTATGHKILTERLPREPDQIEAIMAAGAAGRAAAPQPAQ